MIFVFVLLKFTDAEDIFAEADSNDVPAPLPAPPIRCPMHRLSPSAAVPPNTADYFHRFPNTAEYVHQFPNTAEYVHPFQNTADYVHQFPNTAEFGHRYPNMMREENRLGHNNPWNPYNRYVYYGRNERYFPEQQMRPPRPNERPLSTSPPTIAPYSPQSAVAIDPSHMHNQAYDNSLAQMACESLPVVISSDEDGDVQSMPMNVRNRRSEKRRRSGDSPISEPNGNCRREMGTNSAKMLCRQYGDGHQQHVPQDDLMPLALVSPSRRRDRIPINLSGKKSKSESI